jgi:hypothetical protein
MLESMETHAAFGDHMFPFLYPLNRSLAEEVERLFSKWTFSLEAPYYGTVEGKHTYDNNILLRISLEAVCQISKRPD